MSESREISEPQYSLLTLPHKYKAFVGGFGSGKTWAGCLYLLTGACQLPGMPQGYFAPTYPLIRDIFYPLIDECGASLGFSVKTKTADKEVDLYRGGKYYGTIICRTMDTPQNIIGFKIGRAVVDEIDVLPPQKADVAWNKIIARMRYKNPGCDNSVAVTTTPEGYRFTYKRFYKDAKDNYGMVRASTYSNAHNLPEDYIKNLTESYTSQLIQAYIDGLFVNLTSGSVYPEFDRRLNHTGETIKPREPLHIGMDFNINQMAAEVSVIRDRRPLTLDEMVDLRDTPTMIEAIKARYAEHHITVYPDASGGSTSSKGASLSDITLLRNARFAINAPHANPAIKDRVMAVNGMVCNAVGQRRWLINTEKCPHLTEALEQQTYDNAGLPDKTMGHDHKTDAIGYFLHRRYPVESRRVMPGRVVGMH